MAKKYTGSLTLEWYNKHKALLIQSDQNIISNTEQKAPSINWINKDDALFYQIVDDDGKGLAPYWVNRNDIRVKEARPLIHQKTYQAVPKSKSGTLPGMIEEWKIIESKNEVPDVRNILIKGDNLLALNTLRKLFENKPEEEKIKCIYIDPPYNTGAAFENYEDNLAHSEWLTLMRDRLVILKELLREDGTIFISIDNNEASYLQVLMDSIFGRENRKNIVTLKRGSVTGAKVINPGLVNISEFILIYSKNPAMWKPNRIFKSKARDDRYNVFIPNINDSYSKWKFIPLLEAFSIKHDIDKRSLKSHFGETFDLELDAFVYENSSSVIQFASLDENSISKDAVELKRKSLANPTHVYKLEREGKKPYFIVKGKLILFASDRLQTIDGKLTFSEPATDIWDDVLPNDLHNEGGVEFRKGKKPEKLIQRIFQMATDEGDTILDCFGGSGTSFAVAQKMNRKWIGIEIGEHATTHIIPRLKSVLIGEDQSGISKDNNWSGGGAFKYFVLGPSIIDTTKSNYGDFNWQLGKEFIQRSLLNSYDYTVSDDLELFNNELFIDTHNMPTIGQQSINKKLFIGIASLCEPTGRNSIMEYSEIKMLYEKIRKKCQPEFITLFTNRGIEIAYESKPDDLEIIKVPHAIFADLEK
jgi:adenine-specific DNA-methyltransferase